MGKVKYIVTSALPYIQTIIHLGNLVGSILPADIYYKYLKIAGEDAIFICGSDEHGSAIEITALKEGIPVEQLANENHEKMKALLEQFECTFTIYGRTGTEQNKEIVYKIFNGLDANGNLVESVSEQPYCNVDKRFIPDRFIEGTCPYCGYEHARGDQCDNCGRLLNPKELINPHCNICGKSDITFKQVKNLALNLEKMQNEIKEFIESSSSTWSKNAVNNSLGYIERGLKNREITRDTKWGFKVPKQGYEDKVFYVWFDALIGYIGITYGLGKDFAESYWLNTNTKLVQFMGKDNIEPHTLLWPAMLIGSKTGYSLPATIYAYEFLTWNGQKFSKSRHIGMNLEEALKAMPAEYWRFALASILPETADTDFSIEVLEQAVNSELNDTIGNFIHRTLTLIKSNFNSTVPELQEGQLGTEAKQVLSQLAEKEEEYRRDFDKIAIREALHEVVAIAALGNEYLSRKEPWAMIKQQKQHEAEEVLYVCARIVHDLGILAYPFIPSAGSRICSFFGIEPMLSLVGEEVAGKRLSLDALAPLFQKLTKEQIEFIKSFG